MNIIAHLEFEPAYLGIAVKLVSNNVTETPTSVNWGLKKFGLVDSMAYQSLMVIWYQILLIHIYDF